VFAVAAADPSRYAKTPPQQPGSRSNSFCCRVRRLRSLITPSLGPLITPPKHPDYTAPKSIANVVGDVIVARHPAPHQDPNKTKRPQQDTKTPAGPKTPFPRFWLLAQKATFLYVERPVLSLFCTFVEGGPFREPPGAPFPRFWLPAQKATFLYVERSVLSLFCALVEGCLSGSLREPLPRFYPLAKKATFLYVERPVLNLF
jgi:hypothetical protein